MPIDYALEQKRFVRFKRALTRAQNTKSPRLVLATCEAFFAYYNQPGKVFPDAWHRWQRAQEDARRERLNTGDFDR
jgi:hypothetical protein